MADVPGIFLIEKEAFSNPAEKFDRRRIRYLIRRPGSIVMVAYRGGEVLGWVAALPRRRLRTRWGRIYAVAVHRSARGRGLGERLMRVAMRRLESLGVSYISLEVRTTNRAAIRLYRKLGFGEGRKIADYYGHGRDAVRMMRDGRT